MSSTLFIFSDNQRYTCNIDTNIYLQIERVSDSVSRLHFTDEIHNIINIPENISVHTNYGRDNYLKSLLKPVHPSYYALCWTDNYTITYNKKTILCIESQRCWNIFDVNNSEV